MPYCPKCGKEVKESDQFCQNCGQALSPTTARAYASAPEYRERPTGITILAVLEALGGAVTLFGGVVLVALAGLMGRVNIGTELRPMFHSLLGGLIGVVGVALLLVGLISFALAWGFWTGQGWAWAVGMGVAVVGIVLGFLTLPGGLFRMLIDGLVIYYLTRPYVKRFFNR